MKLRTIDESKEEFERYERVVEEAFSSATNAIRGLAPNVRDSLQDAFDNIRTAVVNVHLARLEFQGLRWQTEVQALQIDSLRNTIERIEQELVQKQVIEDPSQYDVTIPPNIREMTAHQKREWIDDSIETILFGDRKTSLHPDFRHDKLPPNGNQ